MLRSLNVRNHPHLIKLLATYKYKNHYHLVFPFANTNLRGYWDDTGIPHWNRDTYFWFLRQICGIASGLNAIHNFRATLPLGTEPAHPGLKVSVGTHLTVRKEEEKFGRHGDIKPENILWSNELVDAGKAGILQIADMGLGRFHRLESRSGVDPKTVSGSPTYMPPEVVLEKPVSRAYDIWSLGCVFLEFITWLVEGPSEVYTFSSKRLSTVYDCLEDDTFFSLITQEDGTKLPVVRQGVIEWIDHLRENERCSDMVKELLKLVQSHLLVVDSSKRIRSEPLVAILQRMVAKAENNAEYLLGSAPVMDPEAGVKLPRGPQTRYAPTATLPTSDQSSDQTTEPQSPIVLDTPTIIEPTLDALDIFSSRNLPRTSLPI